MEVCIQKIEPTQSLIDRVGDRLDDGYYPVSETIPKESQNLEGFANFIIKKYYLKPSSNVIYGASLVANYEFREKEYNTLTFVYGYTEEIDHIYAYVIPPSSGNPNTECLILLEGKPK